jgi:hypothetical protein
MALDPTENQQGEPEATPGHTGKRVPRNKPGHTLASLGLDLTAHERGRPLFLLPVGKRDWDSANVYPLPGPFSEVYKLAMIPVRRGGKAHNVYLRRARAEYKRRCSLKDPGILEDKALEADSHLLSIKNTRKEIREEVDRVKAEAVKAAATLTDLYSLIRAGSGMILGGFVNNTPVNGEAIDAPTFIHATGKILGHIAKLGGVSEDDKAEAEAAVFEQAVAATRKRLAEVETVGVSPQSAEATH